MKKAKEEDKILVSDIEVYSGSANKALRKIIAYLESDPVQVVSLLYASSILRGKEYEEMKEAMKSFDLVLFGDEVALEVAGIRDGKTQREVRDRTLLKMLFHLFHKRGARIYILAESERDAREFREYFLRKYKGVRIVGLAKVLEGEKEYDKLLNDINGNQADCVISLLSSPFQERFIMEVKKRLDLRVFLGGGREILKLSKDNPKFNKIARIFMRYILKKEMETEEL